MKSLRACLFLGLAVSSFVLLAAPITEPVCQISGFVWLDLNRNGIRDRNEPGVAGVTIKAYKTQGGELLSTQTTGELDQKGGYSLPIATNTQITLEFIPPQGLIFTLANQGNNEQIDSDIDPLNGRTESISLDQKEIERDAGLLIKFFEITKDDSRRSE